MAEPPKPVTPALVWISLATQLMQPWDSARAFVDIRDAQNRPIGAISTILWASSDPSIASVSRGLITAHSPGDATISVTVDGVSDRTVVRVAWLPGTRLDIGGPRVLMDVGTAVVLDPILLGSNGPIELNAYTLDGTSIEWTSSNPLVARVDDGGGVTALGPGHVVVVARWLGLVDSASVDVGAQRADSRGTRAGAFAASRSMPRHEDF
jgi:hypothetical protein